MRSRLHALAIAAAVALPHAPSIVSQSLNPPYLSEMPSVARVKADIKGSDPIDTSARQMGAFWQLMEIINTLAGPRFRSLEFTRDEDRVKAEYFGAWQRYQTTDHPSAQDEPRWRQLRALYEKDTALREELQRFFSAEFRALSDHTVATVKSDASGSGTFPNVPAGTYYVYGTSEDFVKTGARGTITGNTVTLSDTGFNAVTIWNLKIAESRTERGHADA